MTPAPRIIPLDPVPVAPWLRKVRQEIRVMCVASEQVMAALAFVEQLAAADPSLPTPHVCIDEDEHGKPRYVALLWAPFTVPDGRIRALTAVPHYPATTTTLRVRCIVWRDRDRPDAHEMPEPLGEHTPEHPIVWVRSALAGWVFADAY